MAVRVEKKDCYPYFINVTAGRYDFKKGFKEAGGGIIKSRFCGKKRKLRERVNMRVTAIVL